jgi:catechol 2,3-dioxygenase-like lactoylglutathione lyase family enzyme
VDPLPADQQITFLHVHDLDETAQFYERLLGLKLALDQGDCRIYRIAGDAFVGFCARERPTTVRDSVILTLVVADVDACYETLQARGVVFTAPPKHSAKYAIYHAFLRDPDGYLVEIQRFDDPHWMAHGHSQP